MPRSSLFLYLNWLYSKFKQSLCRYELVMHVDTSYSAKIVWVSKLLTYCYYRSCVIIFLYGCSISEIYARLKSISRDVKILFVSALEAVPELLTPRAKAR